MWKRAIAGAGLIALLGSLWSCPAAAQEAEREFFRGKTMRLVVGSGVGGGYDVYARLIAPYLSRALEATVVVENQPGAGGITSLNRLYVTPPDGLTLSFANGTSAAFSQITDLSLIHISEPRPIRSAGNGGRADHLMAWVMAQLLFARLCGSIARSCPVTRGPIRRHWL